MQCYVCARDSRLGGPEGIQRHDETRQYAMTDDMAGKIRLLARETLTHAIAAELSGEDLQGQFRSRLMDLLAGDRQPLRIICDFMLSWSKSISPVDHPKQSKSKRPPRCRAGKSAGCDDESVRPLLDLFLPCLPTGPPAGL